MSRTFDWILTLLSLGAGILILTGHGDFLLKTKDSEQRKKLYDEGKMSKACGITLVLLGLVTGIDIFVTASVGRVIYIVAVILIFGGMIWYIKTKCKK